MKKTWILIVLAVMVTFTACDEILGILDNVQEIELTEAQIVEGLKAALTVGNEEAINILSVEDGFLKDATVKILLPPEAEIIWERIDSPVFVTLGIDILLRNKLDSIVLRMNRAAEFAAPETQQIFVTAITNMTVDDGTDILYGNRATTEFDSIAATNYLNANTYDDLKLLFEPYMNAALNKPLVGNVSTNTTWTEITTLYNRAANSIWVDWQPIETELGGYATGKALDGVFLKVGNIEKEIRKDPLAWAQKTAQDILDLVFGSVNQEG